MGIAFLDISTGEFLLSQGNTDYIDKLLQSFKPTEVIFQKSKRQQFVEQFGDRFYTFGLDEWPFADDYAFETLTKHFEVSSLKGFGVERLQSGIVAAGVILHYLGETEHRNLQHITSISRIEQDSFMWLDRFTIRNLELISSANDNAVTLFKYIRQYFDADGSQDVAKMDCDAIKGA